MRRLAQALMAAVVLATGSVTFSAPAEAQGFRERQRFVERFCARNPGARDCREYRRDYRRWDDRRYNRWYRDNYRDRRDNTAAAIFGFAAGAAAGAAASGAARGPAISRDQVARCAARYRTYDPRTNTYVANSAGERRICRL